MKKVKVITLQSTEIIWFVYDNILQNLYNEAYIRKIIIKIKHGVQTLNLKNFLEIEC